MLTNLPFSVIVKTDGSFAALLLTFLPGENILN